MAEANGVDLSRQFGGKVVAVTGGTSGVGEAVARMFAARGAAGIGIAGRSVARGAAVADALTAAGCPTVFAEIDLEKVADCHRFIDTVASHFGRLDVLANVAGCTDRGTIENTDEATWDRLFSVNVKAPFFLMQRAVERMREKQIPGVIVNIGTIVAYGGPPFLIPYSASKGALLTLTRGLANAVKWDRIRINTLNIGWTATRGEHILQTQTHNRPENWLADASKAQPFGRLLQPDEVARALCFLASDEAGMMTGAVVDMDQQVIGTMEDNPGV